MMHMLHMSEVTVCVCVDEGGRIHSLDTSIKPQVAEVQQNPAKVLRDPKQCECRQIKKIMQVQEKNLELEKATLEAVADKIPKMKHKHHSLPQAHTAKALNSKEGRQLAVRDTATIQKVSHL